MLFLDDLQKNGRIKWLLLNLTAYLFMRLKDRISSVPNVNNKACSIVSVWTIIYHHNENWKMGLCFSCPEVMINVLTARKLNKRRVKSNSRLVHTTRDLFFSFTTEKRELYPRMSKNDLHPLNDRAHKFMLGLFSVSQTTLMIIFGLTQLNLAGYLKLNP